VANVSSSTRSEELLLRFQGGEEEALGRLWARYLPRLKRWAHGRLPATRLDASTDDLVQDAFVRSLSRLRTLKPNHENSLFAFFKTIVMNEIRDYVRQANRRPTREMLRTGGHMDPGPSPLQKLLGREVTECYERALESLREDDAHMVLASVELGFNATEIMELFEKPTIEAARVARARAISRLARAMEADARSPVSSSPSPA
jgi:RNA polymerase sigma-70 factor, ECF subfamily